MEEPGGLQSMGSLRVGHVLSDFTFTSHFHALEKEMATHSSVLAWRIPGTWEPGGLPSMGSFSGSLAAQTKLRTESTRFQGPLAGFCIPTLPEADSVGA